MERGDKTVFVMRSGQLGMVLRSERSWLERGEIVDSEKELVRG